MFGRALKGFEVDDAAVKERPLLALTRLVPLEQQVGRGGLVLIPWPWLQAHEQAISAYEALRQQGASSAAARESAAESLRRAGVYGDMEPAIAVAVEQVRFNRLAPFAGSESESERPTLY